MSHHTRGLWHATGGYTPTVMAGETLICVPMSKPDAIGGQHLSELTANARLIAAAPELLHELYTALPFVEDAENDPAYKTGEVRKAIASIRAALAKADAMFTA